MNNFSIDVSLFCTVQLKKIFSNFWNLSMANKFTIFLFIIPHHRKMFHLLCRQEYRMTTNCRNIGNQAINHWYRLSNWLIDLKEKHIMIIAVAKRNKFKCYLISTRALQKRSTQFILKIEKVHNNINRSLQ